MSFELILEIIHYASDIALLVYRLLRWLLGW